MDTQPTDNQRGAIRVSDAERDQALAELGEHYQAGRLTLRSSTTVQPCLAGQDGERPRGAVRRPAHDPVPAAMTPAGPTGAASLGGRRAGGLPLARVVIACVIAAIIVGNVAGGLAGNLDHKASAGWCPSWSSAWSSCGCAATANSTRNPLKAANDMDAAPMTHAQIDRTRRRPPRTPGDRLATALRRLRWPVLIVWILAIVALNGLSSSLAKATNDGASAYLPASAASTKVVLLQQAAAQAAARAGGRPETDTAIVVFARDDGRLTAADQAAIASARGAVAGLAGHIASLRRRASCSPAPSPRSPRFRSSASPRSAPPSRSACCSTRWSCERCSSLPACSRSASTSGGLGRVGPGPGHRGVRGRPGVTVGTPPWGVRRGIFLHPSTLGVVKNQLSGGCHGGPGSVVWPMAVLRTAPNEGTSAMDTGTRGFPRGDIRVSDAERDQAIAELSEHFQAGRLTQDEFDDRSGRALQARTGTDLGGLFGDLPRGTR